jgi:DNA-binding CsgD family transcriptional regulator
MKHFWAANAGPFRDYAERALNAAREVGEPATQASAHSMVARIEIAQGDPAAAVERLDACRARTIAAGAGWALPRIDIGLAHALAELGDIPTARSTLEPIVASGADWGYTLGLAAAQLTDTLRIAGDLTAAEARAEETLAIGERIQVAVLVGLANEQLARLALSRDEPGHAEELIHRALAAYLGYGAVRCLPQTFDGLAEIAARLDSGEEAARILGAAHRLREELGLVRSRHDGPWIAALEQTLREQLGDPGFGDAFEQGTALSLTEAVIWMRHARGERKRPSHGWGSLTPTELRVVDFVAEGLTNPEIGERMFISRGTVKVHLSHIFAKLNMTSRAELAAKAARREMGANP